MKDLAELLDEAETALAAMGKRHLAVQLRSAVDLIRHERAHSRKQVLAWRCKAKEAIALLRSIEPDVEAVCSLCGRVDHALGPCPGRSELEEATQR